MKESRRLGLRLALQMQELILLELVFVEQASALQGLSTGRLAMQIELYKCKREPLQEANTNIDEHY